MRSRRISAKAPCSVKIVDAELSALDLWDLGRSISQGLFLGLA